MTSVIKWMYHRKNCNTCAESLAFLDANEIDVSELVDCKKNPKAGSEALEILKDVDKVYSVIGKTVRVVELNDTRPADSELLKLLLGPTGNLRAPTIKFDDTVVVGFENDTYSNLLGP